MAWAWVRPADLRVLRGRPLLDIGTGDGQTLAALAPNGLVVGLDRSLDALRAAKQSGIPHTVCGVAILLPFGDATFGCVLAGDLFHHLDDERLAAALTEARRVLSGDGLLVAWWYGEPGRDMVDAPRYPRSVKDVGAAAGGAGFRAGPLELTASLDPAPPTVGLVCRAN